MFKLRDKIIIRLLKIQSASEYNRMYSVEYPYDTGLSYGFYLYSLTDDELLDEYELTLQTAKDT